MTSPFPVPPETEGRKLTVGSLFSGIGGLDLGLERAGMVVKWQAEVDPYCSRVLANHWPDVPNLGDVTRVDWNDVERVDLICGGFPCQPVSVAGKRAGRGDERWLWPEFARCLRVLRPRFALLENVPGLLTLGFGEVAGDLAELGYEFEWDCIPAAAVGAPHLRYRAIILAYSERAGLRLESVPVSWRFGSPVTRADGSSQPLADPNSDEHEGDASTFGWPASAQLSVGNAHRPSAHAHATPSGSRGAASESGWWATEPDVGRVAHGIPSRVDRLRVLGNAVVPQVAEFIGRQLIAALSPEEVEST